MPASRREMLTGEAAKLTPGMSRDVLQKWMRDAYMMKAKPCPFGDAVLTDKGEWQYYIWPERLAAYRSANDLNLTLGEQGVRESA